MCVAVLCNSVYYCIVQAVGVRCCIVQQSVSIAVLCGSLYVFLYCAAVTICSYNVHCQCHVLCYAAVNIYLLHAGSQLCYFFESTFSLRKDLCSVTEHSLCVAPYVAMCDFYLKATVDIVKRGTASVCLFLCFVGRRT